MFSLFPLPTRLIRITQIYAVIWLVALIVWRIGEWLPLWLLALVFIPSLPLGIVWLRRCWRPRETSGRPHDATIIVSTDPSVSPIPVPPLSTRNSRAIERAAVVTAIYPFWWQLVVFLCDLFSLHELRGGLTLAGTLGIFFVGLAWLVWWLERASQRIEQVRLDHVLRDGPLLISPASAVEAYEQAKRRCIWNPLDPQAWYYGRQSRKLNQSMAAMIVYGMTFWIAAILSSQIGGCNRLYEMPTGGGQQKTIAQSVKIQKIIRKKYVVNPYSSIKFNVPPIDEVKLTVLRSDNVSQVIEVDESTSFKKGGRGVAVMMNGGVMNLGAGGGRADGDPAGGGRPGGGESITLADVKVGDMVAGQGGLKHGIFVPTELNVMDPSAMGQRRRRQNAEAGSAGGSALPAAPAAPLTPQ